MTFSEFTCEECPAFEEVDAPTLGFVGRGECRLHPTYIRRVAHTHKCYVGYQAYWFRVGRLNDATRVS
jgi:hypothetical protein